MTKQRIKISSAKAKGRRLQQWVAKQISKLLGIPHGRDELIQSRPMGQAGTDIILMGSAAEDFPFAIECKSGEHIGWQAAIRQAKTNQGKFPNWMIFLKCKNFQKPVVIMDAEVFFEIYEGFYAEEKYPKRGRR